jgi:hypothetical protein
MMHLIGCSDNRNVLPESNISKVSDFHCYPFNAKSFKVDAIEFQKVKDYPVLDYCSDDDNFELTKWTRLSEIDSANRTGYLKTIQECEPDIYRSISDSEKDIYISGCYKWMLRKNGSKYQSYYILNIFNSKTMMLYVFKDLDYYPFY